MQQIWEMKVKTESNNKTVLARDNMGVPQRMMGIKLRDSAEIKSTDYGKELLTGVDGTGEGKDELQVQYPERD